MITEMTKYSFILLSGEAEAFLEKLRETGVVDITRSHRPVDESSSEMMEHASQARKVISYLEAADFSRDSDYDRIREAAGKVSLGDANLTELVSSTITELASLEEKLSASERTVKARKPWGDFDRKQIDGLEENGYRVRFYCVGKKRFCPEWAELYPLSVISEDESNVWFVTIAPSEGEYSFPAECCQTPEGTWIEAEQESESLRKRIIALKGRILRVKEEGLERIRKDYGKELSDLDLYLAGEAGEGAAENTITVFTGFAPSENDAGLTAKFDSMGVFYLKEKATEEDNPPIKLRNNRFTSMFEVLTGMYGMPVYGEFDPTPVLAPFFLLFFSMCMGDAGYGIILFVLGFILKYKASGSMAKLGPLVSTLGVGTFLIGIVLGTFFGIDIHAASWTPEWLKSCMIKGNIGPFDAQMVLAIGIGVFHICLAMTIKAIGFTRRFGFRKTISTWGWLILIVGGLVTGGLSLLGVMSSEVTRIVLIAIGVVSALGIYIFNEPGRNPLVNIGSGLWDTYNMATGLLGDVLSYIRLYALGLAGGMLGNAFNTLGMMVLDGIHVPVVNILLFAVIVLFGHSLNIAMSCLGAFVHPLRLTFVEYFKNSGYEGKGTAYKPLK